MDLSLRAYHLGFMVKLKFFYFVLRVTGYGLRVTGLGFRV
jgi:hypothetical protein